MSGMPPIDWSAWNQRRLVRAIDGVAEALERHAAERGNRPAAREAPPLPGPAVDRGELEAAYAEVGGAPAYETLSAAFGLSPFERDVLLLCAAMELDARFVGLCGDAHGDPQQSYPTFGLALAAFPGAHWSALAPGAPLRYWRLVQLGAGESPTRAPLRVDERVLHYLTGINDLDERLQAHLQRVPVPEALPPSQLTVAERIEAIWRRPPASGPWPAIQLGGRDDSGKHALAAVACSGLGLQLLVMRTGEVPGSADEREGFARLWEREIVLGRCALMIDWDDAIAADDLRHLAPFVDRLPGMLLLTGREPLTGTRRGIVRLQVDKPTAAEQYALWTQALGEGRETMNGAIDQVVAQFDLSARSIRLAGERLDDGAAEGADPGERLWEACRLQARPRLDDLATQLRGTPGWEDLVLPAEQLATLREIATQVRRRARVYHEWGFAGRVARGLGISALFAGPSGTGKTLAAEVLARELRLDIYHIDLSSVVSKYIGETEKNLRRVFDAADDGGAILLFDEADAIFGKRSEVKDSHDRYANLEVSYLLQRMEAYRGLAILTTNFQEALDPAFLRRLRFVVHFPFPDAAHRGEIWSRVFPAATPTEGLQIGELARLDLAGGNIRNIALGAAFLAADAGEPVRMEHVTRAARTEYAKLERPVGELSLGGGSS